MRPRQRTHQQRDYNHDSQCQNTCQVPKIRKTAVSSKGADAVPLLFWLSHQHFRWMLVHSELLTALQDVAKIQAEILGTK